MLNKIKFLLFAIKQCYYDKCLYCLQNAFYTIKKCNKKQLKIIMLNNNIDIEYEYCDCDDIAICINNDNECVFVIDDYCETQYNMNYFRKYLKK